MMKYIKKDKIKLIVGYASLVALVLMTICLIVFSFLNPEMTQTQVVLELWWCYIPIILCVFVFRWSFKD